MNIQFDNDILRRIWNNEVYARGELGDITQRNLYSAKPLFENMAFSEILNSFGKSLIYKKKDGCLLYFCHLGKTHELLFIPILSNGQPIMSVDDINKVSLVDTVLIKGVQKC